MTETVNGVEWVIYLFAEVIPYLLWEAGRTLVEFTRTSPWGTALGILVAVGLWKLLELVLWALRRAWIPILAGTAITLAALAVRF